MKEYVRGKRDVRDRRHEEDMRTAEWSSSFEEREKKSTCNPVKFMVFLLEPWKQARRLKVHKSNIPWEEMNKLRSRS